MLLLNFRKCKCVLSRKEAELIPCDSEVQLTAGLAFLGLAEQAERGWYTSLYFLTSTLSRHG